MSDRATPEPASRTASPELSSRPGVAKFVGAKGGAGVWQQIISQMPPHKTYIEPFLGTGVIMREKRPALWQIGVEIDRETFKAFPRPFDGQLINGSGIWYLETHGSGFNRDYLVYCDPPYLLSTRKNRTYYRHEMTEIDHVRLLGVLCRCNANVILSGYWSALYADMLKDWRTINFTTTTRGGGRVTEFLWMNFPPPFEFHDSRFLGRNFRERERIKRKKLRWVRRLRTMPSVDRAAVLDAIAEARSSFAHL